MSQEKEVQLGDCDIGMTFAAGEITHPGGRIEQFVSMKVARFDRSRGVPAGEVLESFFTSPQSLAAVLQQVLDVANERWPGVFVEEVLR